MMSTEQNWLNAIEAAAKAADQSQIHTDQSIGHLRMIVGQARAEGVSWKSIGDRLGVSRQAAQQRFKDVQ